MFSTSSPTYPASVSAVASAIANGTLSIRARVCARCVLPHPVGPISRMFDLASSTFSAPVPPDSAWMRLWWLYTATARDFFAWSWPTTYWSRKAQISIGLGSSSHLTSPDSASSSSMISLQRSMHSSQMYTPGPAISFFTCFCDFPQKEHLSRSPPSPIRATYGLPALTGRTLVRNRPLKFPRAGDRPNGGRESLPRRYLLRGVNPTPGRWCLLRLRRVSQTVWLSSSPSGDQLSSYASHQAICLVSRPTVLPTFVPPGAAFAHCDTPLSGPIL